jgi:hypothetical protein
MADQSGDTKKPEDIQSTSTDAKASVTTVSNNTVANNAEEKTSRWTLGRVVTLVSAALIGFIIILLVLGLVMAIGNADLWAPRVQLFRDLLAIFVIVQGIIIIAGIAIFIIQVARFISLLSSEVKPLADDTRATLNTVKTTTQFVGKNTVAPLVTVKSFLAGLTVFLREMFAIRRLLRRPNKDK